MNAKENNLIDTNLEKLLEFNKHAIEKAKQLPSMMHLNGIKAIKEQHEMHLTNAYNYKFGEVVSAFIKKYQNEN